ncbi:23S rRNA (uracil(1939)-C(5))-methyltransferase RlmD [Carnobacteriaceae bacterium zg-ZUI252]|nr:23S rRNA (uracil(1939)-C(5))-methyltransferase RlmD [Carnobacteriaceae bacterium zg-ZUI252]
MLPVQKNEILTVTCVDLTHEGMGVAKVDGYPIFIENLLPDEVAKVKVIKVSRSFGVGKVVELLESSPNRVPVTDVKGTWVGTMPLQHLSYDAQLLFKQQQVSNVMRKIAKLPDVLVRQTIGADYTTAYRNKAQIPVRNVDGQLETGFYRKNSHTLVPIEDFVIQDKRIDEIVVIVRDALRKFRVSAYHEETHSGDVRHIMVRRGKNTGQVQVVLVTRTKKRLPEMLVDEILQTCEDVVSFVQNVNSKPTNVILGDETIVYHGDDFICDELMGLTFKISSKSFYQVNPEQTEKLYTEAIRAAKITNEDVVIDAYSGIGTIGLSLAKHAKWVYGMEIVSDAIDMAKENARMNGIDNVTYEVGSAENVMKKWLDEGVMCDVLMVDPPRKGLAPSFIDTALKMDASRIVYVSCNPATMARDLVAFTEGGYTVEYVQPVDMFPMTVHVECVVLLERQ